MKIPMSAPDITEAESEAVAGVLRTSTLSIGPQIAAFEQATAEYAAARHGVGVSSGTSGLHLCVIASDVADGERSVVLRQVSHGVAVRMAVLALCMGAVG